MPFYGPTGDAGTPPIIKDLRGSRKPPKSTFSDRETYSIESGVVDLVVGYQVGVKIMNFDNFLTFLYFERFRMVFGMFRQV